MVSKKLVKLEMVFKQNIIGLIVIVAWFVVNFLLLFRETEDLTMATKALFYVVILDSEYGQVYAIYSEFVVFGLIIGVVTVDALRNYNPRKTAEILASRQERHAIVFGYNQVSVRFTNMLRRLNIPFVVVSTDEKSVQELIEAELPVVIFDENDACFLNKINMKRAHYAFLTEDDHVRNLNFIVRAREMNPGCKVFVKVMEDDFLPVYHHFNCIPFATGALTDEFMFQKLLPDSVKKMFLIGFDYFTSIAADFALKKGATCYFIEKDIEDLDDFKEYCQARYYYTSRDKLRLVHGDYLDNDLLRNAGLFSTNTDVIVVAENIKDDLICLVKLIKEKNKSARVIVRINDGMSDKIFEQLGCTTISTVKMELEQQIEPLLSSLKK